MVRGIKNKFIYTTQLLFPRVWNRIYAKNSIEGTKNGRVYIEWWGYKINLGDWLSNPVVEWMLNRKHEKIEHRVARGNGGNICLRLVR